MIHLSFKQTQAEMLVRAVASVIFKALERSGCVRRTLSEVAESPRYGWTAKAEATPVGPRYVRITDLQDGKIDWDTVPFCQCDEPEPYLLQSNDILFARTGATTGKTHLVRDTQAAVFASYLIRVRPSPAVLPDYLYGFFQCDSYWEQIASEKEGSAQPNVNGQKLLKLSLPVPNLELQSAIANFLHVVRKRQDGSREELPPLPPPIEEQRRIVARIEALAAKIADARNLRHQSWEGIGVLLGRVIAELFEHGQRNGWSPGLLGDYVLDDCYGTSEKTTDDNSGTPILRMGNIQDGKLKLNDLKYLHITAKERDKLILEPGDIIVNRTNSAELVGKCAVFNMDSEYGFASYLIRLRLDQNRAEPRLVAAYINSPAGRAYMFNERKQMTGQANVNATKLKALPIALPPMAEQGRIVVYLDSLSGKAESLKSLQHQSAAELDALLPSMLDKAFCGEL